MHKPALPHDQTTPAVRWVAIDAEHDGQRLDNFLLRLCKGVPKSHLYKAIRAGEVRVNKGRVQACTRLAAGDVVRVPPVRVATVAAANTLRAAPAGEFPIVFEDEALLVIDKPAGVAVHGGSGVAFGVIERLRAARPQEKFLELAHRLDRDTSGLLMLAKNRRALLALHAMLREGRGRKHYLALVAHLRMPLTKWLTKTGERRVRVDAAGQPAHTIVEVVQRFRLTEASATPVSLASVSLLRAELRTGRTHQIRVHLAAAGFPIIGDDKYGHDAAAAFAAQGFHRMFLHAHSLELPHPLTGATLHLQAPLPADCARLLTYLEQR